MSRKEARTHAIDRGRCPIAIVKIMRRMSSARGLFQPQIILRSVSFFEGRACSASSPLIAVTQTLFARSPLHAQWAVAAEEQRAGQRTTLRTGITFLAPGAGAPCCPDAAHSRPRDQAEVNANPRLSAADTPISARRRVDKGRSPAPMSKPATSRSRSTVFEQPRSHENHRAWCRPAPERIRFVAAPVLLPEF